MDTGKLSKDLKEGAYGSRPAVVGHRGNSSVAPQNTLAAVEAACRAGVDYVEIDVQRTADGTAVVIHDAAVDATTNGHGAVSELTVEQVRSLDAGRWFSQAYAGQRVPIFEEVLDLLENHPQVKLLLEFKEEWTPDAVHSVIKAIDNAGLAERVIVQSFTPETVAAARHVAPHIQRALLTIFDSPQLLDVCADLEVMACNPPSELVQYDPALVTRLRAAGLQVMVWTENDPDKWAQLCEMDDGAGVDAIITDYPDRLLGWLAR